LDRICAAEVDAYVSGLPLIWQIACVPSPSSFPTTEHGLAGAGWWPVKDHDGGLPFLIFSA
jgi:hypothetical protein